jgi:hypothetical protein
MGVLVEFWAVQTGSEVALWADVPVQEWVSNLTPT